MELEPVGWKTAAAQAIHSARTFAKAPSRDSSATRSSLRVLTSAQTSLPSLGTSSPADSPGSTSSAGEKGRGSPSSRNTSPLVTPTKKRSHKHQTEGKTNSGSGSSSSPANHHHKPTATTSPGNGSRRNGAGAGPGSRNGSPTTSPSKKSPSTSRSGGRAFFDAATPLLKLSSNSGPNASFNHKSNASSSSPESRTSPSNAQLRPLGRTNSGGRSAWADQPLHSSPDGGGSGKSHPHPQKLYQHRPNTPKDVNMAQVQLQQEAFMRHHQQQRRQFSMRLQMQQQAQLQIRAAMQMQAQATAQMANEVHMRNAAAQAAAAQAQLAQQGIHRTRQEKRKHVRRASSGYSVDDDTVTDESKFSSRMRVCPRLVVCETLRNPFAPCNLRQVGL